MKDLYKASSGSMLSGINCASTGPATQGVDKRKAPRLQPEGETPATARPTKLDKIPLALLGWSCLGRLKDVAGDGKVLWGAQKPVRKSP